MEGHSTDMNVFVHFQYDFEFELIGSLKISNVKAKKKKKTILSTVGI